MSIYTHLHHIIPRHAGGTDDPSNLVELTIEDHAIAHEVRYRMFGDERDAVAARMIRGQISHYDAFIEMVSRPKSEAWKQKARERNLGEKNPMWGKTISEKQKEILRKVNSTPKPHVAKNMRKLHEEEKAYKFTKKDCGARIVIADGVQYESLRAACDAHGLKNHNSGRYRINSDKWDWHYA